MPSLDAFVLASERLGDRLRSVIDTDNEEAIGVVHNEINHEFLHHLGVILKASIAAPSQLEPLYSLTHGFLPKYLMDLDIRDARVGMMMDLVHERSARLHRKVDKDVEFRVHEDKDIGKIVLRTGYLLIPHEEQAIAYRYEDVTRGDASGVLFHLLDERWPTIDDATAIRANKLASVISVRAPKQYDVARTILPLFASKYPRLENDPGENPNKGDDWEILEINGEPVE
jgi:hypothetical protein